MTYINTRKDILKNLVMAALPIALYNIMSYAFFMIYYYVALNVFQVPEEILDGQGCLIDSLSTMLLLLIFLIWFYKSSQNNEKRKKTERFPVCKALILTFGMGGVSGLWFMFAEDMLISTPVISESMQSFEETWAYTAEEPYFWILMSVVIVGPIAEELLFRGLVFQYLERIKKGCFPIIISGIAFGLWHEEPVQVVYTALMGIGFGIIYAKTRDLRFVMVIHILNNFFSSLPPALDTEIVQENIYYISLIMIVPAMIILWKMCVSMKESKETLKV